MLARIHGKIQFECDGCAEVLDTETADFEQARAKLRKENWRTKQHGRDWSHFCAGCKEKVHHGV